MSLSDESDRGPHPARAVGLGLLGGACFGTVDALGLALFGDRVPAAAPWLALGLLTLAGGLAGCVLSASAALASRWWPGARRRHELADADTLVLLLAGHGASLVLLDRQDWVVSPAMVRLGLAAALAWLLLGPWLLSLVLRRPPRHFAARVTLLALFFHSWVPMTEIALAKASPALTWSCMGGLFGLTCVLFLLGTLRRRDHGPRLAATLLQAGVLGLLGGAASSLALRTVQPRPLERSIARPLEAQAAPPPAARPNVLLVVMDTTRRDHLSAYGYSRRTTPHLETLAQSSIRYDRAVSTSSWTLPAHASLFTGLYPSAHGAHMVNQSMLDPGGDSGLNLDPNSPPAFPLAERHQTLAEAFAEQGYDTAAVVANTAFLDRAFGLSQGFEHYDDRARAELGTMSGFTALRWVQRALDRRGSPIMVQSAIYRRADTIRAEALEWLDGRDSNEPFFLFLNFMDPHGPYHPPAPFDTAFPGYRPALQRNRELARVAAEVMSQGRSLSAEEFEHYVSRYDGEIAFVDSELGRLFDGLRERGQFHNTLIVVTADHGESFGERGFMGHGACLHGEEVDVPLLVRPPGGTEPTRDDAWISLRDLPGLIARHVGLTLPEAMTARLPLDEAEACLSELFQRDSHVRMYGIRFERDLQALYLQDDLKFVRSSIGEEELYDKAADPGELRPIDGPVPDPVVNAVGALMQWLSTVPKLRIAPGEAMSEEMRESLRRLGYLDEDGPR